MYNKMTLFGNRITSNIIAKIFQKADETTRNEMIEIDGFRTNERDRVSVLCRGIRRKVNKNPFIRSLSISANAIDTHQGDALFVFRYKNEIKVGLLEAKLLKINGSNLNKNWDYCNKNSKNSHFTRQIINQQQWINAMAVWDMFIPNCKNGQHSPPLISRGSSNIWADEIINHSKINTPNLLWNYNDLLNPPGVYQSLYTIIKTILNCDKGRKVEITTKGIVSISSKENKIMEIPIPYTLRGQIFGAVDKFIQKNKNIASYNYYRFDDMVKFIENYKEKRELSEDLFVKKGKNDYKEFKFFKQLLDEDIK